MEEPPEKRFNRKRKKSFIKNARKYGKKGCFGRGSQLEADLYNYLVEILTHFKEIENDEDKSMFVNNVFEQMEGQEENCCYNQVGCRVIETLLPHTNEQVINKLIDIISKDFRRFCTDTFASHVVEAVFTQCYEQAAKGNDSSNIDFVLKVAKFLLNNLEDFVWNNYANHIIRTVLLKFCSIEINVNNNKSKENILMKDENIPGDFKDIVKDFGERILSWPQILDLAYNDLTSGLLQIILTSLFKIFPKLIKSYFKKFIDDCFVVEFSKSEDSFDEIYPRSVIALLECFLQNSDSKMFTKIYTKLFQNKLANLAKERKTNFAVQKLIDNCKEKSQFEAIFEELVDHFEEISNKNHTGVLLSLGNACKRLGAKQGAFMISLMKLFECSEPIERQNSLVLCLSKWEKFPNITDETKANLEKDKLHLHGTLIVQTLLFFNKPIKVVNSILSMDNKELKGLFCNSMGSHIVDSFVKSPFVGEKSREKLIRKMQWTYQELVSSKYGSRSFEALWEASNLKLKCIIMEELSQKDANWSNSQFGKIIANKIHLTLFKRNKDEWKNTIHKNNKKENALLEIFK